MVRDNYSIRGPKTTPDRIGKVFLVLSDIECLCLICDGVFTRGASGAGVHANVGCHPKMNDVSFRKDAKYVDQT